MNIEPLEGGIILDRYEPVSISHDEQDYSDIPRYIEKRQEEIIDVSDLVDEVPSFEEEVETTPEKHSTGWMMLLGVPLGICAVAVTTAIRNRKIEE